jgi:hypothetical protein
MTAKDGVLVNRHISECKMNDGKIGNDFPEVE